ncbi:hypothetical protein BU25DRAFT_406149 [Macroventuria anomochaeta]|uniref:Uncharacterized protein n=1 Tax=Macroventuria anomochaeta TaxID=301207 RepID=A0ACB6SFS2_9PLEO|nr:uncharacterized protein BU25DRAFT_406149 [Macroventuria anomochaeta]KAF2632838.1 hypothetical protein BU25DRAFT_406149 [Macroventuria anomochaeta]
MVHPFTTIIELLCSPQVAPITIVTILRTQQYHSASSLRSLFKPPSLPSPTSHRPLTRALPSMPLQVTTMFNPSHLPQHSSHRRRHPSLHVLSSHTHSIIHTRHAGWVSQGSVR